MRELLRPLGFHLASPKACETARDLAAQLISPYVAPATTLQRVQEITQASVFVQYEGAELLGVVAVVLLSPAGLSSVETHGFDPRDPSTEHLCAPGDRLAGLYGWGFAARTRKASAEVLAASIRLREHFWAIPFFTRAATPAGARALRGRLGYSPYPGAPDDLLWNPVRTSQERAA